MLGEALEQSFLVSRQNRKTELIFFINAGDPSLDVTFEMLRVLARHNVATVELCVPFPNSLTDGPLIKESHRRALLKGTSLNSVLRLVTRARDELGLAVVLLADYSHSVKPLGLESFLHACFVAGVYGTLVHGLPPKFRKEYIERSAQFGLGRVMSFFIGSEEKIRCAAYQQTLGYIYVVSKFGKTGQKVDFDKALLSQLAKIRSETEKPLAVGFGVKTANDILALRSTGIDAVIIGSAATAVVQKNIDTPEQIATSFDDLVERFGKPCVEEIDLRT